jgi:phosphoserine phosphatase
VSADAPYAPATPQPNSELVVTLIAATPGGLLPGVLKESAIYLRKSGGKSIRTGWLAEGEAADIFCAGLTANNLRSKLIVHLKDRPLDIIVQPVASRRKKFLVADMESTIIQQEMLDELADLIGKRDEVVTITQRAMNGEIDFAGALRARVTMLKGLAATVLDEAASRITYMPGAEELIATLRNQDVVCWLVSGGFTCFAEPVAAKLGFARIFANTLVVRDGIIAGEVEEPILDKNAKRAILEKGCSELGVSLGQTVAIGDGANDVPMLCACNEGGGMGVAYHAKPRVKEAVAYQVNQADLKALLYAQGHAANKAGC